MVYTIDEITTKLTPIFKQNGVTKAVLFGSYAKGIATDNSDVDIAIKAESNVRGLDYVGILLDIQEALNKDVDMIPYQDIVPNGKVDSEVSKTGVVIYEQI